MMSLMDQTPAKDPSRVVRSRRVLPLRVAVALLPALWLGGCASEGPIYRVNVRGEIPAPIVERLPLTAVVHYPVEFINFTSEQESLQGASWQVSFVDLHQKYLQTLLISAFDNVIVSAEPTPPANLRYDVFIVPQIDDFSFLTPAESGTKFFAASMRHFLNFYDGRGRNAGAWEVNSYGRSRSSFTSAVYELAEEACLNAMRDFAASIAVGLPKELRNREILADKSGD